MTTPAIEIRNRLRYEKNLAFEAAVPFRYDPPQIAAGNFIDNQANAIHATVQKITLKKAVCAGDPVTACAFLAEYTPLSKLRIKDAMQKGAVWLKRETGKEYRIRRATAGLNSGDRLSLYYDEMLLALKPPKAENVADRKHYSTWYKPAGLMTQGTKYGDHCSLLRQSELYFRPRREVHLIHRLDREASGVVLIAHSKSAAARLSRLFRKQLIIKRYRAEVLGNVAAKMQAGTIEVPLDGKSALTEFVVEKYDSLYNSTLLTIFIRTGRKHQIRRHLDMIGFPVMGDPRYGQGNKNTAGMQLAATALEFDCPFSGKHVVFENPHG